MYSQRNFLIEKRALKLKLFYKLFQFLLVSFNTEWYISKCQISSSTMKSLPKLARCSQSYNNIFVLTKTKLDLRAGVVHKWRHGQLLCDNTTEALKLKSMTIGVESVKNKLCDVIYGRPLNTFMVYYFNFYNMSLGHKL